MDIQAIGVLSANTVGTGLAEIFLKCGCQVRVFDNFKDSLNIALAKIKWSMRQAGREDLLPNLEGVQDLSKFDGADMLVETLAQDLEARRQFFSKLKPFIRPECVVAVCCGVHPLKEVLDSSDLPKDRTLGFNFQRPVRSNPLVELVRTDATRDDCLEAALNLLKKIGKTPVIVKDNPGQIVERLRLPFILSAFKLLEAGKGLPGDIDGAFRAVSGAPLGPLETADFIGLDRGYKASQDIYEALGRPERLTPSAMALRLVQYGQLGRKSTIGFYIYEDGRIVGENPELSNVVKYLGLKNAPKEEIFSGLMGPVIDEARALASEIMASEHDIETAMKLAMGWPKGPLAYGRDMKELFVKKRTGEFDSLDAY